MSDRQPPEFLQVLGLGLPVTMADIDEAYRARVKVAHPDLGGTATEFIQLQRAVEEGRQYARRHALGWLAASVERYAAQEQLAERIRRLGGRVVTQRPEWISREVGEDFAQVAEQITAIDFSAARVSDTELAALGSEYDLLRGLHTLDLSGANVTDAGVLQLRVLIGLRRLILNGTRITPRSLEIVRWLPDLKVLKLARTNVGWLRKQMLRLRYRQLAVQ